MPWFESRCWAEAVSEFWFEELSPEHWFGGGPGVDALIRERFGGLREELKEFPPNADLLDAGGHVAAVVVFDQFSRNIFRNSPEAFTTDAFALALAHHAIDAEMDLSLDLARRRFLYMPFMHSENAQMQMRSVELFRRLGDITLLGYAENDRATIERFGRFPHRNAALGRPSRAEEQDFLRIRPGCS